MKTENFGEIELVVHSRKCTVNLFWRMLLLEERGENTMIFKTCHCVPSKRPMFMLLGPPLGLHRHDVVGVQA